MCAAKRVQDGWPQRWAFRPGPGGAAKLAKPAADSNPALLEAFKAVVAAGGSDWLDPEAVAAVVTGDPPDSAAKCEKKAPGSPKVAEPEAAVPTPGAPASPTPQPNAEAGATESLPVLQPDPSFGSVALGDGSLLQADPKEIWIFGHSVISAVKKRANNHPCGLQLAFPITSVFVYWHDVQEMLWDQLVPLLHEVERGQLTSCKLTALGSDEQTRQKWTCPQKGMPTAVQHVLLVAFQGSPPAATPADAVGARR
ncbi:spidroin-2-like [Alligator mississippiensis]|uniref:Spidroin-2-like n=1 Tax=Alligator mississippiensis TaxID=8496 RepID=A0A151N320_ALLMI|nr:spidroin-2-like [Alligator mississippiensis]